MIRWTTLARMVRMPLLLAAVATTGTLAPVLRPQLAGRSASPGWFQLVGHSPLLGRGMNAALALAGSYAYIGSRTDGTHPHAGVLVVNIARPQHPVVVAQIGPPNEGTRGATSRELRVWPQQHLLIVMTVACSALLHACASEVAVTPTFRFYDIAGADAARPRLVATWDGLGSSRCREWLR